MPSVGGTRSPPIAARGRCERHRHHLPAISPSFRTFPSPRTLRLGREPGTGARGLLISHGKMRAQSAREAAECGLNLPLDTPVRDLGVAGKHMTEIARALAASAHPDHGRAHRGLRLMNANGSSTLCGRLAASGVGIIYISHFLEELEQIADRITVLRDGNVVASTAPASER